MIRMMKAVTETTAIAMIPPFERPELESTIQEKRKHFKKSVLYHLTTWKWLRTERQFWSLLHSQVMYWLDARDPGLTFPGESIDVAFASARVRVKYMLTNCSYNVDKGEICFKQPIVTV